MNRGSLKTMVAVGAVVVWFSLWGAGLWELLGKGTPYVGKAILWLFLAGFLGLLAMMIGEQIKRRRLFRKKGYLVTEDGQRRFVYRELFEGGVRELRVSGEWIENGHPVYYRVSQEVWAETVPEWARERRLEIEGRILEDPFFRPEEF